MSYLYIDKEFSEYLRECLSEEIPSCIASCYDFAARETEHETDYDKRQVFAACLADEIRNYDEITALINRVMNYINNQR